MARGGSNADRARGGARSGRAFKKTLNDRDSNSESSYLPSSRPKFQESLKNQENSQGKYYDDKRVNGNLNIKYNTAFTISWIVISHATLLLTNIAYFVLQRTREFPSFCADCAVKMITITSWCFANKYRKVSRHLKINDTYDGT